LTGPRTGYVRWTRPDPEAVIAVASSSRSSPSTAGGSQAPHQLSSPEEDPGLLLANVQLPAAASVERTESGDKKVEEILAKHRGVQAYSSIIGFSLLSRVSSTYNAFMFIQLKPWSEREGAALEARGSCRT